MPRTWRAGGIIGPTTAKQNAGAGGVEVAREVRGAEVAREVQEAEETRENAAVLEKLEKNGAFATLAGEGGVADNSVEESRKVRKRCRTGKTGKKRSNTHEENAAVL